MSLLCFLSQCKIRINSQEPNSRLSADHAELEPLVSECWRQECAQRGVRRGSLYHSFEIGNPFASTNLNTAWVASSAMRPLNSQTSKIIAVFLGGSRRLLGAVGLSLHQDGSCRSGSTWPGSPCIRLLPSVPRTVQYQSPELYPNNRAPGCKRTAAQPCHN